MKSSNTFIDTHKYYAPGTAIRIDGRWKIVTKCVESDDFDDYGLFYKEASEDEISSINRRSSEKKEEEAARQQSLDEHFKALAFRDKLSKEFEMTGYIPQEMRSQVREYSQQNKPEIIFKSDQETIAWKYKSGYYIQVGNCGVFEFYTSFEEATLMRLETAREMGISKEQALRSVDSPYIGDDQRKMYQVVINS